MKRDTLIKVAISFGDTRNVLNKMKEKGIAFARNREKKGAQYLPDKNKIIIGKQKTPRVSLVHEYGHATHILKNPNQGFHRPNTFSGSLFDSDKKRVNTYSKTLKQERIANNNGLNVLKDKSSREHFKEHINTHDAYKSYKKGFGKFLNTPTKVTGSYNMIEHKKKMKVFGNSTIKDDIKNTLNKKPWER